MPKKVKTPRRKSRVVYVSFDDPELAQRLIEHAASEDRTISTQIVRIIRQYYTGETEKATA